MEPQGEVVVAPDGLEEQERDEAGEAVGEGRGT